MEEDKLMALLREYRRTGDLSLVDSILKLIHHDIEIFVAFKVCQNDLRDVVQEGCIEIFRGLRNCRAESRGAFFLWCQTILRACIARHHKHNLKRNIDLPDAEELQRLIDSESHVSETDKVDLEDALNVLKESNPECAILLYERYILRLSFKEIGDAHGISEEAARKRVERCENCITEV